MFDGHGGREVAKYAEKHYPRLLKQEITKNNSDLREAMRKSFLEVDVSLNNGGLAEVG